MILFPYMCNLFSLELIRDLFPVCLIFHMSSIKHTLTFLKKCNSALSTFSYLSDFIHYLKKILCKSFLLSLCRVHQCFAWITYLINILFFMMLLLFIYQFFCFFKFPEFSLSLDSVYAFACFGICVLCQRFLANVGKSWLSPHI